jgi:hypothetical protein
LISAKGRFRVLFGAQIIVSEHSRDPSGGTQTSAAAIIVMAIR